MEDTLRRMELKRTNYQHPRRRVNTETKVRAYSGIVKQLLVSIVILGIVLGIRNYQNPTAKFIMSNIKTSLTQEVNLKNIYSSIYALSQKYIKEFNKEIPKQGPNTTVPAENNKTTNATTTKETTKPNENVDESVDNTSVDDTTDTTTDTEDPVVEDNIDNTVPAENTKTSKAAALPVISSLDTMDIDAASIKKQYKLAIPVMGRITSTLAVRTNPITHKQELHPGLDIEANKGTPIKASLAGKVVASGRSATYGNFVRVETGELTLIYAHCSKLYVKTGDKVKRNQKIAAVGSTGMSTGNHLHFEILRQGRIVDPQKIINIR